ncbi:GM22313 [Drosophila sechellia]|uniref:GM22313 n=1 Tax=Drosophila sechellia TaxID=7238 RepID=B4IAE3_DROSE|nr:GM22313 [Drosophila sechellia]
MDSLPGIPRFTEQRDLERSVLRNRPYYEARLADMTLVIPRLGYRIRIIAAKIFPSLIAGTVHVTNERIELQTLGDVVPLAAQHRYPPTNVVSLTA